MYFDRCCKVRYKVFLFVDNSHISRDLTKTGAVFGKTHPLLSVDAKDQEINCICCFDDKQGRIDSEAESCSSQGPASPKGSLDTDVQEAKPHAIFTFDPGDK